MNITVIGAGNIGLVVALTFARLGHQVIVNDTDKSKINQLQKSKPHIYEPELTALLEQMNKNQKIIFTESYSDSVFQSDIFFICVGTPPLAAGELDTSQLYSALNQLNPQKISRSNMVILKSTVTPGTTDRLSKEYPHLRLAFNPEFIREGSALSDFRYPDRIVVGSNQTDIIETLKYIYSGFLKSDSKFLVMDPASAELCKYASNIFLATRVSLINEFSRIAETCNANIDLVSNAVGLDHRIGTSYLKSSIGYGGSCLPKDISAMISFNKENNLSSQFFEAIQESNEIQFNHFYQKIVSYFEENFRLDKRVTIWGVSFKPLTNDLRSSPSIKLIHRLRQAGFQINIHDPKSLDAAFFEFNKTSNDQLNFFEDPHKALENTMALIVLTAWPEYQGTDLSSVKKLLKNPVIFDAQNMFNIETLKLHNIEHISIGRPK